jgi:hypothetical protein
VRYLNESRAGSHQVEKVFSGAATGDAGSNRAQSNHRWAAQQSGRLLPVTRGERGGIDPKERIYWEQ